MKQVVLRKWRIQTLDGEFFLEIPEAANIIRVRSVFSGLWVYVLLDELEPKTFRRFTFISHGDELNIQDDEKVEFLHEINTDSNGWFVVEIKKVKGEI